MTEKPPVVIVVDDDDSFRNFLSRLVSTIGLRQCLSIQRKRFSRRHRLTVQRALCLMCRCPV